MLHRPVAEVPIPFTAGRTRRPTVELARYAPPAARSRAISAQFRYLKPMKSLVVISIVRMVLKYAAS